MTLPISVIIPNYNQEEYLPLAIESVKEQADDIVVVHDDTGGGQWGYNHGNIRAFSIGGEFRAGVCYARNIGIVNTYNNLILPLDADDRLYPDALERMFKAWRPNTFVYGNYTEIAEDESAIREMQAPPPEMIFRKNLTYSTFLFDRADWQKVGGYDVNYEFGDEDYQFQVALVNAGVKPIRLEGAPLYKRMVHQNGSRTERAIKYFPMVLAMLKDQFPNVMKP